MIKSHILLVDDDKRICVLLERYLVKHNFIVSQANCIAQAQEIINKYVFDLIILDCMLPDESGLDFLIKLRKKNNLTPIVMLTALGDVENRIEGLSYGADDYIGKPFEPQELLLRIQNILKRANASEGQGGEFLFGNFVFNTDKDELKQNDILIKLTDVEIKILKTFIEYKNQVLTRQELCNFFDEINERSIDVQITRLRKKIENNPKNPQFLKTIRNKGYIFHI